MNYYLGLAMALSIVLGLFTGMLALVEIGRRAGAKRKIEGLGAIEGAVFGLMALLIAFTFGSAAVRFETRRNLVVEEVNDIGTAWLRLDLIPAARQPALRALFRQYVDTRIAVYKNLPDLDAARADLARMTDLQNQIWASAIAGAAESPTTATAIVLLPALNTMFDITTTRTVAMQTHQPAEIFVMLAIVMLSCSLLAGYGMGSSSSTRSMYHIACFALVLTLAYYVILDLEYPRMGMIRIDWMDQLLVDVRASMGS